jgi:hypothetical protein
MKNHKPSNMAILFTRSQLIHAKLHLKWTAKEAKSRFESLKKKHTEAHKALNDISGKKFGLSEKELKQGLTIQQKLEKLSLIISGHHIHNRPVHPQVLPQVHIFSIAQISVLLNDVHHFNRVIKAFSIIK